jgi:hypothetical protein
MTAARQSAATWCGIETATLEDIALDAVLARDGALALAVLGATYTEHDSAKDGALALAELLDALEARGKLLSDRRELGSLQNVLQNLITVADAIRSTLRGAR